MVPYSHLIELAAQLRQPVTLLQRPGTCPLALFGQGAGELLVLRPFFLQLLGHSPLFFFQPADLAPLKVQLQTNKGQLKRRENPC